MGLILMHRVYPSMPQRPLRRIFIATLLSIVLGVGSVTAPADAAPATPSIGATLTAPSAVVAGEYYIKSALADDLVLDVWAASRECTLNPLTMRANQ